MAPAFSLLDIHLTAGARHGLLPRLRRIQSCAAEQAAAVTATDDCDVESASFDELRTQPLYLHKVLRVFGPVDGTKASTLSRSAPADNAWWAELRLQ